MSKTKITSKNIESLMDMLTSKDGMVRQKARKSLVALGKPAVSSLIKALQNSTSDQVRWEAAKALGAIGDTRSISPLVKALADSDSDVAWLAAEALSKFKKTAWPPLLRALIKNGPNYDLLRLGAHHVMVNQKEVGFNDLLANLMKALEPGAVSESAIVAAFEILERMKAKS
jgi:roadblock/LC7 domain-containing protein